MLYTNENIKTTMFGVVVVVVLNKNSLDVTLAAQQKNAPLSKISSQ